MDSGSNPSLFNHNQLDIQLYAGMNMSGQLGLTYVMSYTTNLNSPTNWMPLATNTMAGRRVALH
jgi:hypothetical protein